MIGTADPHVHEHITVTAHTLDYCLRAGLGESNLIPGTRLTRPSVIAYRTGLGVAELVDHDAPVAAPQDYPGEIVVVGPDDDGLNNGRLVATWDLDQLLTEQRYQSTAGSLGDAIQGEDGTGQATRVLERLS